MSKELTPLEAFDKALDVICCQKRDEQLQHYIDTVENALAEGEKAKKVLEIIKERGLQQVNWIIHFETYKDYCDGCGSSHRLPQDEYDLLKEEFE